MDAQITRIFLWLAGVLALVTPLSCAPTPATPSTATQDWGRRLTSSDAHARADAIAELVKIDAASAPLLKQLMTSHNASVRAAGFEVAERIGPGAIGVLSDMLHDRRVSNRRQAADLLIDLAPETETIQQALCDVLRDPDSQVARDAARALGALGERAAPSVGALTAALSHSDEHVRLYAAEALASIGPAAAPASETLAAMLQDPVPGVRWAACEGLAGIGPPAAPGAVPPLIQALADDSTYVRICAAGALGSIGSAAHDALTALRQASKHPPLHAETTWAIARITGVPAPAETTDNSSTPAISNAPTPPATTTANSIPHDWDITTGRNIAWSVELGNKTFARPVVAGDVVYQGTDNAKRMDPAFNVECGVLMAFRASDATFLWQDAAPRVKRGLREFLLPSTTSAPYVEGNHLYYLTAECQLRCLELPKEQRAAPTRAWELDLCAELGVFPHEACNSEVLPVGDLLILCTSNGRNEAHTRVPSPRAPSLIAVDKRSGKVAWRAIAGSAQVLHGQWSSPTAAQVNGRTQILFGGGDGWLRGYDATSGRELWRFDGNPKDALWRPRAGAYSRCGIVASPVYDGDGRVFVAMGEDPSHGNGPSVLHAVSPGGQGDVTQSRRLWTCSNIGRVVATPVIHEGLLYVGDLGGKVYCLDAKTGEILWTHDTEGAIWGCLTLANNRLCVGNDAGTMTILQVACQKKILATIEMEASLYSRPTLAGDSLYLATARRLYRIASPRPLANGAQTDSH